MTQTIEAVCASIVDCEHKSAPIDDHGTYFAVGTPAMRGNRINYDEARRINLDTFQEWTRRLRPRFGDLLFAREAPVGPVVRVPQEENIAPGQRTMLLRPDPTQIDSDYFYYLLTSSRLQAQFEALSEGSTVPHLNVADVKSLVLPALPGVPAQRAIADVLGSLDDKIAANTKLATITDDLAGALLRQKVNVVGRTRLDELAIITMGSSPAGETLNEVGEGTVFFQGVRDFGLRFPARRVWTAVPTRWADEGDLLVSVRAPVGEINIAPERLCIGRGLASVRSKAGHQATLFHLLRHDSSVWEPFEAEGTVFGSINRNQLHGLSIGSVPVAEADALEERLAALEKRIAFAVRENEILAATRDALLPALMSGRLTVRQAERIAEDPTVADEHLVQDDVPESEAGALVPTPNSSALGANAKLW